MALIHCHFFSQVLRLDSSMCVILPEPFDSKEDLSTVLSQRLYPTLYLLHGLSDDHTIWQRRTSIERYVEGLNLAVVMPAVQRSMYTDTVTGQDYFEFISVEVPAIARGFFPLSNVREDTYVAGLSMGGYGAFKLALSFPERYAAAASLSGALDMVRLVKADYAAGEEEWLHVFGDPDAIKGSSNDLFHLAEQVVAQDEPIPKLFQWCGTEDFLYEDNLRFRDHAKALTLDLLYEEDEGDHEWRYWDEQIQQVLAWLPGLTKP